MPTIQDVWLLSKRINRGARQIVNTRLGVLGLSSAEGNILLHMLLQDAPWCQEQLVEQLDIGKAAVSRAVASLTRKGYLHREQALHDRRYQRLMLTDAARAAGGAIQNAYDAVYSAALRGVSDTDFDTLIHMLRTVAANLADGPSAGDP